MMTSKDFKNFFKSLGQGIKFLKEQQANLDHKLNIYGLTQQAVRREVCYKSKDFALIFSPLIIFKFEILGVLGFCLIDDLDCRWFDRAHRCF